MNYYEELPILFKYKNENNGYLYLTKLLNRKYNICYNDLSNFKMTYIEKVDTSQVLNYNNIFFIDFKKIKLVDNENIFKFINLILIKNNKSSYKFIKYDFNVLILFNINYINENYISKLTNIIENFQEQNNFILLSSYLKINDIKFHKLRTLCSNVSLNVFKEFKMKLSKNEKDIFKMLNYDITKYNLFLSVVVAKNKDIKISKISYNDLYKLLINNILLYNILHNTLINDDIYTIVFNLISMFSIQDIKIYIINMIYYSTINKLNNHYDLKNTDKLVELNKNIDFNNYTSDLITLKKFVNYIKNILDNISNN